MSQPAEPTRTSRDRPLKWAGILVILFAVLAGLGQASKVFLEIRDRDREAGELQAAADRQRRAGDFPAAWASLERAAAVVDRGGSIARLAGRSSDGRARLSIRTAQEDLAMAWLQNWQPPGQPPAPLPETLVPTLTAGAAAASGARKADLLAHLGWEAALRGGPGGEDTSDAAPESFFRQAVEADPSNPYAHAHWGYWLAWQQKLGEASSRFDAALASGRARPYVRAVQLAALLLHTAPASGTAYIAAVADMIRNGEAVDAAVRDRVYALYAFGFEGEAAFAQLTAALPAAAQIALVRTLFIDAADRRPDRTAAAYAWLARLQEAAGDQEGALASWRSVLSSLPPEASGPLADRARAAVAAARPALLR